MRFVMRGVFRLLSDENTVVGDNVYIGFNDVHPSLRTDSLDDDEKFQHAVKSSCLIS